MTTGQATTPQETSPDVSAVLVNYNAGPLLRQAIDSVCCQGDVRVEIIVVDNASGDGSLASVVEGPQLRVIRNEANLGFARGQNQGIAVSRGRFVLPLNYDVRLAGDFMARLVQALESNPAAGDATGKLLRMTPAGEPTAEIDNAGILLPPRRFPRHRGGGELDHRQYDSPALVFGAMAAAAMYRRAMLEDIAYQGRWFDESFFTWYEDIDLDWRARSRGWECLYVPEAVAYHVGDVHGHGASPFGARHGIRNRWRTIAANECGHCLRRNAPALLAEELALLRYVTRRGWLPVYARALAQFLRSLPAVRAKRRWIRGRARRRCLPDYPLPVGVANA